MQTSDSATEAQRARLLARVQESPIDTLSARTELNILHPAARIQELRDRGYPIKTHLITKTDEHGRKHQRVALYYIGTLPCDESKTKCGNIPQLDCLQRDRKDRRRARQPINAVSKVSQDHFAAARATWGACSEGGA